MFNISAKKFLPILILGMIIFSSCKKVLDVPPTIELESNYFTTEDRVQKGIGAIYASVSNIYGANLGQQVSQNGVSLAPLWLLQGDDLTTSGSGGDNAAYEAFSGFSPSDPRVGALWQKFYFLLARANFMLEKLEDPEISKVFTTPALRTITGEKLYS